MKSHRMGEPKAMSAVALVTRPAHHSADDHELVAAVRAGDDRAFELLFVRYQRRIAAYVRGMVRDEGRAEDVTQEIFLSALRRMRATDREIDFKPWIYEIAKNACIDAFRRSRNVHEVSFDADDGAGLAEGGRTATPGPSVDAVVDTKMAIDDLCGAFGALSQAHHDILVLREFDGRSYREIGERLGMSRAAVESTLFRARRRLGEEYEEIASGRRCMRVRDIVDTRGRAVGLRDQRRMARHVSHCQPCRRYALSAGVELAGAPASVAARIAALVPLPPFLRRRFDEDAALLGHHATPALNVVCVLDPVTVSGWSRAVAAAATFAIAGLGAGAAVGERDALSDLAGRAPAAIGLSADRPSKSDRAAANRARATALTAARGAGGRAALEDAPPPKIGEPASATDRDGRDEPPPTIGEPSPQAAGDAPVIGSGGGARDVNAPTVSLPAVGADRGDGEVGQ